MLKAGIKTQASLAEKIAENEGIETPPKDTVNRAFREEKVSPATISRIALVLNVTSESLYQDEEQFDNANQLTTEIINNQADQSGSYIQSRKKLILSVIAFFLVSAYLLGNFLFSEQLTLKNPVTPFTPDQGQNTTVVIVSNNGDVTSGIEKKLKALLDRHLKVSISSILAYNAGLSPWKIPDELSVDYVIYLQTEQKGKLQMVFADLLSKTQKQSLFADAWRLNELNSQKKQIAENISNQVLRNFNIQASSSNHYPVRRKAVIHYVNGANNKISGKMSLENINQAITSFQKSLNLSPGYMKARASLCIAFSDIYFITKEIDEFKDAISQCESYKAAGQSSPEYLFALGEMYRRLGNLQQSIDYINQAIKLNPDTASFYARLAKSQLLLGSKKGDNKLINESLVTIDKAIHLLPDLWSLYHEKALIQYLTGDTTGAITTQEKSVSLSANVTSLNNLASFNFCNGKLSSSEQTYKKILQLKDSMLMTKYNLASVYSFQQKNEQAIALIEKYMNDVKNKNATPAVDAWVGLADAYRAVGNNDKALLNYEGAYREIESARVNGKDSSINKVYLQYIQIAMLSLKNQTLSPEIIEAQSAQLTKLEPLKADPNVKTILVFAWSLLDRKDHAKKLYTELIKQCEAFAEAPIFDNIRSYPM